MLDITNYTVSSTEPYTHIVLINNDQSYLNLDSPTLVKEAIQTAIDEEFLIAEKIGDISIPYICINFEPEVGAQCLSAIMKRLYNSHSAILSLDKPESDTDGKYNHIICAPYTRVNREMLKEITESFDALCKYRNIEFQPQSLQFLPLTWNSKAYKDGSETDMALVLDEEPHFILSTTLNDTPLSTKVKMNSTQSKKAALIDSILMYSREEIKGDQAKALELLPLISKDRSRDMSFFLAMGRCLYRIFSGSDKGLDLWRDVSIEEMHSLCDEYWPTLDTTCTYYRIHTLQFWASKDSPKEYAEWNSTSIRAALEASVLATGGILDIAEVAYRKNPTLFICDGDEVKDASFFMFNGTYYKPCGTFALQRYLIDDIIPEYSDFLTDLSKLASANSAGQGADTSFKEMIQKKIDKCIKIIVDMKKPGNQKSIVETLMLLYNKPGFDNIRDSNPNLTAFEDCVFDAERKCIRDGIPEDNLTSSTGYEFREYWNELNNYVDQNGKQNGWEHPHVKLVVENLDKIIFDREKQEILRREFASLLHASNPLKRGVVTHGPTNNGKSQIYSWLSKALGTTYCPDVPNNLFYCQDSHPGVATPHMELGRFARICVQSEVDDTMTLNEALFKRWTGCSDKVTYRGLYKSKIKSYVPVSKPHTVCNSFAKINGNSAALRTRTLVLKLDSKFITEKDPEYEIIRGMTDQERDEYMRENHWYWANTQFSDIINETFKAFMWVMIQDYCKYCIGCDENGRQISSCQFVPAQRLPKSIVEDTVSYFIKSNIYLQFIRMCTRKNQEYAGVSTFALYNAYKRWYSDNIAKFGNASLPKFIDELAAMGMRPHNDMYGAMQITYQ